MIKNRVMGSTQTKVSEMTSNKPTYDDTTGSLRELLTPDSAADATLENASSRLQIALREQADALPQEHTQVARSATRVSFGRRVITFFRSLLNPLPAAATLAVVATIAVVGVNMVPSPPIQGQELAMTEVDMTFQELWLAEDTLLFADDL